MAIFILKQGEDKLASVFIKDSNGNAVDVSVCGEIRAILLVDGVEQKRYSLTEQTDYGKLEVDEDISNKLNIFLEREDTKDFAEGIVSIAVLFSFPDALFVDETREEEYMFTIGRIVKGFTKTETL